jgi:hypothetical protein
LFGNQELKSDRTELMLFITPRVVEGSNDIDTVINDLRRRMDHIDEYFPGGAQGQRIYPAGDNTDLKPQAPTPVIDRSNAPVTLAPTVVRPPKPAAVQPAATGVVPAVQPPAEGGVPLVAPAVVTPAPVAVPPVEQPAAPVSPGVDTPPPPAS